MNSKKFIKSLKNKDKKALEILIDNYSDLIFKVSYGILKNKELSLENVNDVILKIWNNAKKFDREESKFAIWVMVITKYTAIDCLRKEKKHYENQHICDVDISSNRCIEEDFIVTEKLENIKNEISNMNKIDKEIFLRKFFMDHTSKEISESLGVTEKFINLRIFRGRKKLKEKMIFKGL